MRLVKQVVVLLEYCSIIEKNSQRKITVEETIVEEQFVTWTWLRRQLKERKTEKTGLEFYF